jgi:hypothetical protein
VAPATPAGTYTLTYEICEVLNPSNCDQATVTVQVDAAVIIANDDTGVPVNGYYGGVTLPNVLASDLLNGAAVIPAEVVLTQLSSSHQGVFLIGQAMTIAPLTPAGIHTLTYEICEVLNPANCDQATVTTTVTFDPPVRCVSPKVFLQAPFDPVTGLMWDSLRVKGYIPLTEPYSSAPYSNTFTHTGGGGGETISSPAVLGVTGNNAIVDWVFIELRNQYDSTQVVATRSGLLHRNGDITDVDGTGPLCFENLIDSVFYVVIRHRNHLGVMTATPKVLPAASVTIVDFRYGAEPEFDFGTSLGNNFNYTGLAQAQITQSIRGLWSGDVNGDGVVKYIGQNTDRTAILGNLLTLPGNINQEYNYDFGYGYHHGDINLDGKVKYNGPGADRNILLFYLISYPLNVQQESNFVHFIGQLP